MQTDTVDEGKSQYTIKDGQIEESRPSTSQEEHYIATKIDVNNNSAMSDHIDETDADTEWDDLDLDDDVRDPDWKPKEKDNSDSDENTPTEVHHEEVIENCTKAQKRKYLPKERHMKEIQKKKRMRGETYMGLKMNQDSGTKTYCVEKAGRLLCPRECSRKCNKSATKHCNQLSQNDRERIFEMFWKDLDWQQKRMYVNNHVERCGVMQRTTATPTTSRRQYSYVYCLTKGTERIAVCKNMFLTTLGIGEKTVYNWLNNSENGMPKDKTDNEREKSEEQKAREENIKARHQSAKDFLTSIQKVDSHYCRASSTKKYLEPLFESKNAVYQEYCSKVQEEGKTPLYKTGFFELFDSMNLSIWKPKKDQCDKCCEYEAGNIDEEEYNNHLKKKDDARESKVVDKQRALNDKSVKVLSMDLQSLLVCPKLAASALYYKMKLSCHNFTIYDLASHDVQNYFWHEGEGELNANVFASCLIDHLNKMDLTDVTEIVIFSDGCTYQNRNSTMANALLQWSMKNKITVYQKYLERGHTQMECDSVHSCIERKVRSKPIYIPQQYVENIQSARRVNPYKVEYLDHRFFKKYEALNYYNSIRPGSNVVTDIRVLKYHHNEGKIQYKLNHTDTEFKDIPKARSNRTRPISTNDAVENLYKSSIPIKKTKYEHLMQLKAVLPKDYHSYYDASLHS